MKFSITVRHVGENELTPWKEAYDRKEIGSLEEAIRWGRETIARFNSGLKPGEREREFVGAEILGPSTPSHEWEKDDEISLMMLSDLGSEYDGSMFEGYICTRCGATGKRYGMEPDVRVDDPQRKECVL